MIVQDIKIPITVAQWIAQRRANGLMHSHQDRSTKTISKLCVCVFFFNQRAARAGCIECKSIQWPFLGHVQFEKVAHISHRNDWKLIRVKIAKRKCTSLVKLIIDFDETRRENKRKINGKVDITSNSKPCTSCHWPRKRTFNVKKST